MEKSTAGLSLSIFPIRFDVDKLRVGVQPYFGDQQLRDLRSQHRETHIFRREADEIFDIGFAAKTSIIGTPRTISSADHLSFIALLVRNSILNHLFSIKRPVYSYHPLRFLATGIERNILTKVSPFGVSIPEWLAIRPLHILDARVFAFRDIDPFIGIAMDIRTRRLITASARVLIDAGLNISNLFVGVEKREIDDPRLEPQLELLGRVSGQSGENLLLKETKGDVECIAMTDARVEANWQAMDRSMDLVFGEEAESVRDQLTIQLGQLRSGPYKLQAIQKVGEYFQKQEFELIEGHTFKIEEQIDHSHSRFPESFQSPAPVFVFDPNLSKTSRERNRGLSQHGPYSAQTFGKNRPKICVICQERKKGLVDKFLHKFFNGIESSAYEEGFQKKMRVETPKVTYFTCTDASSASYEASSKRAITAATESNERWDLCFVQIDEEFRSRPPQMNPYLSVKRLFMSQQTPVQSFKSETAGMADKRLAYAMNNISLASYAKLNGIPWLLTADRTLPCELVFGLGSSSVGHTKLGKKERFVGITTVFSGAGHYWVSNISPAVVFDEYEETLIQSVRQTVERVSRESNWQVGDNVRLVFHVFKPLKNTEINAVKQVMKEIGDYDVEYAFLHVEKKHPYLFFDTRESGKSAYGTPQLKGQYAPARGRSLHLSDYESLLVSTGPEQLKRPEDGIPFPILLKLHRDSTFKDMTYLTRQAYAFTFHSWRTFAECDVPVTVYYSSLVASLLGELSQIPQWDPDVMLGRIGRTRWFL